MYDRMLVYYNEAVELYCGVFVRYLVWQLFIRCTDVIFYARDVFARIITPRKFAWILINLKI